MPEATDSVLTALAEAAHFPAYRIDGPRDSADARYLGVVGLAISHATFHVSDQFPFSGELSDDSRFEIRSLKGGGKRTVIFVVFRQFDSSRSQATPEDIVAGWVPESEAQQARDWVDEMNKRIRLPPVNRYFAIRTYSPGTLAGVVKEVERVLGCSFHPACNPGYDGQPAFEARSDGLLISLVESLPVEGRPRRIRMTGVPDRHGLPVYTSEVDLSLQMLDLLALTNVAWCIASPEKP